ncbi:MAG: TetR/AcrR family transcriptional regulator [Acidimicrobiales bacterium]|nr:TetR/AcrR family transcriptional regulator [Acidimicrobiales bacterium]
MGEGSAHLSGLRGDDMTDDKGWVRAPRQARSQATLERFVEATRQLLEERGFEDITVADIVNKAERTVGSFYARFDDKYAVLHVLVDRLHQRIGDVVRAFCDPVRWEGVPLADFVAESVRLNVQAYRRSGSLFRAALQASATDERFRRRRMETMQLCAEEQKRFVLTRTDEMACANPARASDMMFELVSATLDHELLFGRFTTTSPANDLELVEELTDQCLHVLRVRVPADSIPS